MVLFCYFWGKYKIIGTLDVLFREVQETVWKCVIGIFIVLF